MASEIERLSVVETKIELTKTTVDRIESKLDQTIDLIIHNYVPRQEFDNLGVSLRKEISEAKTFKFMSLIATVLTTAIITGLISFFLTSVK